MPPHNPTLISAIMDEASSEVPTTYFSRETRDSSSKFLSIETSETVTNARIPTPDLEITRLKAEEVVPRDQ
jgi:hypothetical protein